MSALRSPSPTPPIPAPTNGPSSAIPGRRRPRLTEGVAPAAIESAVAELRERGLGAKDAARIVAGLTGRSARELYRP